MARLAWQHVYVVFVGLNMMSACGSVMARDAIQYQRAYGGVISNNAVVAAREEAKKIEMAISGGAYRSVARHTRAQQAWL